MTSAGEPNRQRSNKIGDRKVPTKMAGCWREIIVSENSESEGDSLSGFSGSDSDVFLEFDADDGADNESAVEERCIEPYMFEPRLPRPVRPGNESKEGTGEAGSEDEAKSNANDEGVGNQW